MDIYQEHGYGSRDHYLVCMSEDYGVPLETVKYLSDVLGSIEDFDGLIMALEEY